jgi:hypothetical protein
MVLGIRERTGRSVTPKTDKTSVQLSLSQFIINNDDDDDKQHQTQND